MFRYKIILRGLLVLNLFFYPENMLEGAVSDSLFASESVLNLELRADFSAIEKERTGEPVYHPGELIQYSGRRAIHKLSVRVMARGNFRRKPENCFFPPLFIDFRKNEVANTVFSGQNRLKLVTPCQDEEDVIDEYTIYKLYNQVTDYSFRVRLAKIRYFDTSTSRLIFERHSFFIENEDHLFERHYASEKKENLTPYEVDSEIMKKLSVFQYIIGNTDWFISINQNIVLLQPADEKKAPVPIPYDFDFSAFVDAGYINRKEITGTLPADRRIYKGICYTEEELREIFSFYRDLKPVFKSIIRSQDLISPVNRKKMIRYVRGFYVNIRNKEFVKQTFLDVCESK